MKEEKGTVVKITAIKRQKVFETESIILEDSNESYVAIFNPFYSYVYEEIEKMRKNKNSPA